MKCDEYAGTKITPEMLETLAVPGIVKQVTMSGLFKPKELKILFDKGQGSVETGIREIGSILELGKLPDPETWDKGVRRIIIGAINLGIFLALSKSRRGPSDGGRKPRKDVVKWKEHVRTRTRDLFDETPKRKGTTTKRKGTTIRDLIIKEAPPPGIRFPNDRGLYEFVLSVLREAKSIK